ncbi:MAG: ATP-binding protein [Sphaerochaetaceae bacterium]|nr:ATP-binding protein [Sphaerochaetaceae bacterium]
MIQRPLYLERLKERMWNDSIKIITGIRRCGKSFLLKNIFYDYLLSSGVDRDRIIMFSFDSALDLQLIGEDLVEMQKARRGANYKKFMSFISSRITDEGKYYFLLDEIQMLESFEFVLNGYLSRGNIDIYVTGSNSKFLSTDVVTEFRGRGDEIHVMPLSFSEFYAYRAGDVSSALAEYMTYGGMPRVVLSDGEESKMKYLTDQLNKTYIKDVVERNNLKNTEELNELLDTLASGISSLTNPLKLENTFLSEKKVHIGADTISRYIKYFRESYILDKALRYDLKGRKYISTPFKIYFEDTGLRNARLSFRQIENTHLMENVIFNELKYRGFMVDVGNVECREKDKKKMLEIDFIANKGSRRFYIQSAYSVENQNKMNQETRPYDLLSDSFKKIVVVFDKTVRHYNEKGYLFISLEDFLLNEEIFYY